MLVLDLDDTLCEFIPTVLRLIRSKHGISIDPNLITSTWMTDHLEDDILEAVLKDVYTESFYSRLRPVFATSLGMKLNSLSIQNNVGVTYITGRQKPLGALAGKVTRDWLDRHWFPAGEVRVCHHTDNKANMLPKGTKLVVEDSVHVAEAVEAQGIPVCLIDWPWNNHYRLRHSKSLRLSPVHRRADYNLLRCIQSRVL